MKTSLVVSCTLSIFLVGTVAYLVFGGKTPAESSPRDDTGLLADLNERLKVIEERVDEISKSKSRSEFRREPRREIARRKLPAETKDAKTETAVALVEEEEEGAPSTQRVEQWLDEQGLREEMEAFVAQVYMNTRSKRKHNEQLQAAEKRREYEELSQGPYGENNYRVNALAKKLNLDDQQKDYYNNLLTGYGKKRNELHKRPDLDPATVTPVIMQEHIEEMKRRSEDLHKQFDDEMLLGLNSEQQEAYLNLADHERGLNGGRSFFHFGVDDAASIRFSTAVGREVELKARAVMHETILNSKQETSEEN